MIKHVVTASLSVVVGLVVGGLPARSEVRDARAEVARLRERDCGVGGDLAAMFGGRPMMPGRPHPPARPAPVPESARPSDAGAVTPRVDVEVNRAVEELPRGDELEVMRTGLDLRRTQARAALLEEANPDPEQLRRFDAAVTEMNAELRDLAEVFVRDIASRTGEEPNRHELMVFAADTLDVLITAGNSMRGTLSDEQQSEVTEESVDPFSYVEPSLVDLLSEIDR